MRCPFTVGASVLVNDAHTTVPRHFNVKGAQLKRLHATKHSQVAMSAPNSFVSGNAQPGKTVSDKASSCHISMITQPELRRELKMSQLLSCKQFNYY